MPQSVYFFDHRLDDRDKVASIEKKLLQDLCKRLKIPEVRNVSEAMLVLGHFTESEISDISEGKDAKFPDRQVVIFVTTKSGYSESERPHCLLHIGSKNRYLLFVRNMQILGMEDVLTKILQLNGEDADQIVRERGTASLGWTYDPFQLTSGEVIPALVILCQGYLAVHAEYNAKDEKWKPEEIVPALKQMGWTEFMGPGGPGRSLVREDLKNEVENVRRARWWLEIFGLWDGENERAVQDENKWDEFMSSVEKEWDKDRNGRIPDGLIGMIKTLKRDEDLASPGVVGDAYCAIAKRLGG